MEFNSPVWSSAGSAGTVDVADISKVQFNGSVVRLPGIYLSREDAATVESVIERTERAAPVIAAEGGEGGERVAVGLIQMQATIRYQIAPNIFTEPNLYTLNLFCRRGGGEITAKLIWVVRTALNTPAALTEVPLVTMASQNPDPLSFVLEQANDSFQSGETLSTYYVEVTLTAYSRLGMVIINPPELAVVEAVVALP